MKHQIKMKTQIFAIIACISLLGCKPKTTKEWTPKIGDRVQTQYRPDNFGGPPFITTITNVVNVGSKSQTGLLVYGDGLPGVDSWWVKPAP